MEIDVLGPMRRGRLPSALGPIKGHHAAIFIGTAVLLWAAAEFFGMSRSFSFVPVVQGILVLAVVPAAAWAVNGQEQRLRHDLEEREQQLRQHQRELSALNRLFQSYLVEDFSGNGSIPKARRRPLEAAKGDGDAYRASLLLTSYLSQDETEAQLPEEAFKI